MFRYQHTLVGLAIAAIVSASTAAEPIRPRQQLMIQIRAYEGDPNGSVRQGTRKVLAEPTLITEEGRSVFFNAGGEVALVEHPAGEADYARIGTTVDCKPGFVHDGKMRLDLNLTIADVVDRNAKPIAVRSESLRTIVEAKLGEKIVIGGRKQQPGQQRWVEITVNTVLPDNLPQTPQR